MTESNTPLTEEQKMRRRVARTIGRTIWRGEFKATNPDATKEEMAAGWKAEHRKWTKYGIAALGALEKEGAVITAPNGLAAEENED